MEEPRREDYIQLIALRCRCHVLTAQVILELAGHSPGEEDALVTQRQALEVEKACSMCGHLYRIEWQEVPDDEWKKAAETIKRGSIRLRGRSDALE